MRREALAYGGHNKAAEDKVQHEAGADAAVLPGAPHAYHGGSGEGENKLRGAGMSKRRRRRASLVEQRERASAD